MLTRIREILLTQYIGAIVTALLILDAISHIIQLVGQTITWEVVSHSAERSTFAERLSPAFTVLPTGIRCALYVIAAYLLIRWLYAEKPAETAGEDNDAVR